MFRRVPTSGFPSAATFIRRYSFTGDPLRRPANGPHRNRSLANVCRALKAPFPRSGVVARRPVRHTQPFRIPAHAGPTRRVGNPSHRPSRPPQPAAPPEGVSGDPPVRRGGLPLPGPSARPRAGRPARAVCVLGVLTSHLSDKYVWHWLSGGLGVNVFFVLSGYLITMLALREERANGRLSLSAFYVRRTLRIFPLYYLAVLVYCALMFGTNWGSACTPTSSGPCRTTWATARRSRTRST